MLVVGRRVIPWVLHYAAHTGSRELFRLAVYAVALGVAFGAAALFGVSFALGAFFAGMVLGESQLSQRAAEEALPLRDAFAVLFFVSVGMLFDPRVLVEAPLGGAGDAWPSSWSASRLAALPDRARLRPSDSGTALTIAASLAQIGEFSFILAGARRRAGAAAGGGARPDPGRRDPLHPAQPVALRRGGARPTARAARARPRPPRRAAPSRPPRRAGRPGAERAPSDDGP